MRKMPDFRFDTFTSRMAEVARIENARMRENLDGERGFEPRCVGAARREAKQIRQNDVRQLWHEGLGATQIAETVGCARNTVVHDLVEMRLWKT